MEYKDRLDFALDATGTGFWVFDPVERMLHPDDHVKRLWGASGPVGLDVFLASMNPDDAAPFATLLAEAGKRAPLSGDVEVRIRRLDTGAERWIAVRCRRFGADEASEIVGTARDVTDLRHHDAHVHTLMREVTHRSKNLLAIIQAMARQTVKDSLTAIDFELRFSSRLRGLSFSHELLAAHDWRGAALEDLTRGHLAAVLEQHGDRVAISGPALSIRPEAAQNIGLALNELTSNAVRFGALSRADGRVSIEWTVDSDAKGPRWLHLVWNEYGHGAAEPPLRQGFGHKVMERVVARALDGSATMTFAPTGFQWSLRIPVSYLIAPDEDGLA